MTVISPEEVATILRKSLSWVYAHASQLGASRIGGSLIFTREGLDYAFEKGKNLASQGHGQRKKVHQRRVQHKESSTKLGTGSKETLEERGRRHNLVAFMR